jgi:hypothetical protein
LPPGITSSRWLCLLLLLAALEVPVAVQAQTDEPITVEDPHYGEILFYFYQQDYFPAIVRALAAEQRQALDTHAEEAELLLGGMYLSFGHHLEAAAIFDRLLADAVSPAVRDRTWFYLAKIWYQRGYLDKAQQALSSIRSPLPEYLQPEALLLEAQILIDDGQYDAAIARLQDWPDATEWSRYAKYNVGVALARSGRIEAAASLLDELGRIDPFNDELTALRDKANLALGYAMLQGGQASAAREPLQRVRLHGPFSNKALLGVGWADAEGQDFQRALVPWMELQDRNLLDSAVQESMLAIPYAMARLDATAQAAEHYLKAIDAFANESGRLERTITRIESNDYFDTLLEDQHLDGSGWYWRLENLPDSPETHYLPHLLATHEFQEALKNYRDLRYLRSNLDQWRGNIGVYVDMLDTRRAAYESRLPVVHSALKVADVDSLFETQLELNSELERIEADRDWLALAAPRERSTWQEILALEQNPVLGSGLPDAEQAGDKIALLKGVLQWDMEREFRERLWRARRELQHAEAALAETRNARGRIDNALRDEPRSFDNLGTRIDALLPRLDRISRAVDDALAAQRAYLRAIAVGELRAQQERLETYTVQARFALAAIYDISAASTVVQ